MPVGILRTSSRTGTPLSDAAKKKRKERRVVFTLPDRGYGGRGRTEYKRTPSRLSHTGIGKRVKRGKRGELSVIIQRKVAWYNAQHEAEKRGIDLDNPSQKWQQHFDYLKTILETPITTNAELAGGGVIGPTGLTNYAYPTIPGGAVDAKGTRQKQNVDEMQKSGQITWRRRKTLSAEQRLLQNRTPVQLREPPNRTRNPSMSRGQLLVMKVNENRLAREEMANTQPPTKAIASGPPPVKTRRHSIAYVVGGGNNGRKSLLNKGLVGHVNSPTPFSKLRRFEHVQGTPTLLKAGDVQKRLNRHYSPSPGLFRTTKPQKIKNTPKRSPPNSTSSQECKKPDHPPPVTDHEGSQEMKEPLSPEVSQLDEEMKAPKPSVAAPRQPVSSQEGGPLPDEVKEKEDSQKGDKPSLPPPTAPATKPPIAADMPHARRKKIHPLLLQTQPLSAQKKPDQRVGLKRKLRRASIAMRSKHNSTPRPTSNSQPLTMSQKRTRDSRSSLRARKLMKLSSGRKVGIGHMRQQPQVPPMLQLIRREALQSPPEKTPPKLSVPKRPTGSRKRPGPPVKPLSNSNGSLTELLDEAATQKDDEPMQVDYPAAKDVPDETSAPPSTLQSPRSRCTTPNVLQEIAPMAMETDPPAAEKPEPKNTTSARVFGVDPPNILDPPPPQEQLGTPDTNKNKILSMPAVTPQNTKNLKNEGEEQKEESEEPPAHLDEDEKPDDILKGQVYGHRPVVDGKPRMKLRCKVVERDSDDEEMDTEIRYYQQHIMLEPTEDGGQPVSLKLYGGWINGDTLLKWPGSPEGSPVPPKPKKVPTSNKKKRKSAKKKPTKRQSAKKPRKSSRKVKKTPRKKRANKGKGKKTPAKRPSSRAAKQETAMIKNITSLGTKFQTLMDGFFKSHNAKMTKLDARIKRCSTLVAKQKRGV